LFGEFNVYQQIETMNSLPGTIFTESQFAKRQGKVVPEYAL